MAKRYIRINWEDYPSTATPRNAVNLNKMDKGIKDCDDAIGDLALLKTTAKSDLVAAVNEQNDNFAQGTFTPIIRFGGNSEGITYSRQDGIYHKIGKIVFAFVGITLTSKGTSSGNLEVGGLPFKASTWTRDVIALQYVTYPANVKSPVAGFNGSDRDYINVFGQTDNGALAIINNTHVGNNAQIEISFVYPAK